MWNEVYATFLQLFHLWITCLKEKLSFFISVIRHMVLDFKTLFIFYSKNDQNDKK